MSERSPYQLALDEIALAATKSGRSPEEITLLAVSKSVNWDKAQLLYNQGQRIFGENRLTDAFEKQELAPKDCEWHFIGHLQSNKVRKAVGKFSLIHSVNSLQLAKKISDASLENGVITPILLQANTSGEDSKQGATAEEWLRVHAQLLELPGISLKGLMTMAPLTDEEKIIRQCFAGLRSLKERLQLLLGNSADLHHLSMGMSHDFKIAIQEGATLVRIGTALFENI